MLQILHVLQYVHNYNELVLPCRTALRQVCACTDTFCYDCNNTTICDKVYGEWFSTSVQTDLADRLGFYNIISYLLFEDMCLCCVWHQLGHPQQCCTITMTVTPSLEAQSKTVHMLIGPSSSLPSHYTTMIYFDYILIIFIACRVVTN